MTDDGIKLCLVINPAFALITCYGDQYAHLRARGYEITAVAGVGEADHAAARALGVTTHVVPMERYGSVLRDLRSLAALWRFFRRHRFDVVQVSTPKAGFLGILAARLAGQRHLMYLVRGRAYECQRGPARWFYTRLDALCCRLADMVVPVSASLADALRDEKICPPEKLRLVSGGSSRGVDMAAFAPTAARLASAAEVRRALGIPSAGQVVLFVGWVRREKGLVELVEAMQRVRESRPAAHLVVLGDPHEPDDLPSPTWRVLEQEAGFHWHRRVADTAPFFLAADLVVLPSWREGFPRVVLEAGAAGRAVVTTTATGCCDSVVDGQTGVLVPVGDAAALAAAIASLLDDPDRCAQMGRLARRHVEDHYAQEVVWSGYETLLRELAAQTSPEGASWITR